MIQLNFEKTQKLHAEGMLLFVAELRLLMKMNGSLHHVLCTAPRNEKVCQVFEQIGLSSLLGISTGAVPLDDDVVAWRFSHGHRVEGEKYNDILAIYDNEIAQHMQEELYTGITEAMTNVSNHAYDVFSPERGEHRGEREWWMFSQLKDNHLSVSFCDLGAGIPRTLPTKRPNVWKRFLLLGKGRDSAAIEYSVKDSISRTGHDHRGKGLGQIARLVNSQPGAKVAILSNGGFYLRHGRKTTKKDYRDSIMGTMIHWTIPLASREET